ncbi:MAG: Asp-tRNA(Asn)/Glu-tRNA(Gln) amidotransferase subunit GatA [Synechococcaceae cyanobacterium SM2_3_1]|nr:Asp-tRNA(Asn)/Glu-tRNA(Gln) amidotransferase subunit GatA [Synechococcaceae cyanobacterium SM2_3_1]
MSLIRALHTQLINRERTAVDIAQEYLNRAQQLEAQLHSFLTLTPDLALEQAARVDQRLAKGESLNPLAGIPIAIKDNMCTQGIRTTCASRILEHYIPPYESTVTARLQAAGMVMLGKTNLDEFAMGSSTENSAFQRTANPWDLECVPGGSSGGSAAAVAANQAVVSLGSDTGGSIRQPASFCGVVGMKPTYGLVSRYGLVAFASSLDQIGPFGRTVEDVALVLQGIAGHDPLDSTSLNLDLPDYTQALQPDLKGFRVGVIQDLLGEGCSPEVAESVHAAVAVMKSLGASIVDVSCPSFRYGLATYYIIAPSEASANLARYDGVKYGLREEAEGLVPMYAKTRDHGFGPEVKRRIMIGTYALSSGYYDAYYLKAQKVRTLIKQDFTQAFAQADVLISPTSPSPAFKAGDRSDPLSMYLSDLMTIPVNLAGLPGLSLPCGFVNGLPVGLQIIGNILQERQVLRAAYAYEQATDWHQQQPKLS